MAADGLCLAKHVEKHQQQSVFYCADCMNICQLGPSLTPQLLVTMRLESTGDLYCDPSK